MPTLSEAVFGRVVRDLINQHSGLMFKFAPSELDQIIAPIVADVCDDWPEDQGFGTSDSYGIMQSVIHELNARLEARGEQI